MKITETTPLPTPRTFVLEVNTQELRHIRSGLYRDLTKAADDTFANTETFGAINSFCANNGIKDL
jgi:hypothetical protein